MLLAETQKFDIYTCILDASHEAPCAQICNEFHIGNLLDFDTVYNFGKKVDVLTIEIENVNIDALDRWFGSLSGPALDAAIFDAFKKFDLDESGSIDRWGALASLCEM